MSCDPCASRAPRLYNFNIEVDCQPFQLHTETAPLFHFLVMDVTLINLCQEANTAFIHRPKFQLQKASLCTEYMHVHIDQRQHTVLLTKTYHDKRLLYYYEEFDNEMRIYTEYTDALVQLKTKIMQTMAITPIYET